MVIVVIRFLSAEIASERSWKDLLIVSIVPADTEQQKDGLLQVGATNPFVLQASNSSGAHCYENCIVRVAIGIWTVDKPCRLLLRSFCW
jgi:hypothetical protein